MTQLNSTPSKLYRYDIVNYANMSDGDEYGRNSKGFSLPNPIVQLSEYDVVKVTPKGYWIRYNTLRNLTNEIIDLRRECKWVTKTSKKRFAYTTKEDALNGFIYRKKYQLKIMRNQILNIEIGLDRAVKMIDELYK